MVFLLMFSVFDILWLVVLEVISEMICFCWGVRLGKIGCLVGCFV